MDFSKLKKEVLLKGGQILDPLTKTNVKGDILIKDGKIKAIGKVKSSKSAQIIDCKDLIITHGFCDVHAHFREPGREDKETLREFV